jgi:hypothetical protein
MKATTQAATVEIEIGPGECLRLPDDLARQFSEGTWILSIRAKGLDAEHFRVHEGFFAGYSDEDEGLYDDYVPAG